MGKQLTKVMSLLVLFCSVSGRADEAKLGDVMFMLSDQFTGLVDLTKKTPADLDEKAFARAQGRCRGAKWLLEKIEAGKGSVDLGADTDPSSNDPADDKLVPGELTPPKFSSLKPEQLLATINLYSETLIKVSGLFSGINAEIGAQATTEPSQRDFTALKKLVVKDLSAEMTAAHKLFR